MRIFRVDRPRIAPMHRLSVTIGEKMVCQTLIAHPSYQLKRLGRVVLTETEPVDIVTSRVVRLGRLDSGRFHPVRGRGSGPDIFSGLSARGAD